MNYTIIISDGVFISKEPKPEPEATIYAFDELSPNYLKAIKDWHSNKIPVENAYKSKDYFGWFVRLGGIINPQIKEGQQIPKENVEIKDGKATITKINNKSIRDESNSNRIN